MEESRHGVGARIAKHLPWPLMRLLLLRFPRVYQLLAFGTSNINTKEHWDEGWTRHGRDGFRATAEIPGIRAHILNSVPRGVTVLDVGCGVGEMMSILRDVNACQCSGLDIAPSAIASVAAKGMRGKVATLPEIPYQDATFDAVVCTETLEHVIDVPASLRSICRVLKPGGVFVMSVPDGSLDEEGTHLHRFTLIKLKGLLRRQPLAVDAIELVESEGELCPSLVVKARRLES